MIKKSNKKRFIIIFLISILIISGIRFFPGPIKSVRADPGDIIKRFPSPGSNPQGLATKDGYLWNVDSDTDSIFKINPDKSNIEHCEVVKIFNCPSSYPTGIDIGYTYGNSPVVTKKIFIADGNENLIYTSRLKGNNVYNWEIFKKLDFFPSGLACQMINPPELPDVIYINLWVSDLLNSEIYKISYNGDIIKYKIPKEISNPSGLEFKDDYLFTLDPISRRIYKLRIGIFKNKLEIIDSWEIYGNGLTGLSVDGNNIWYCDKNLDEISKMNIKNGEKNIAKSYNNYQVDIKYKDINNFIASLIKNLFVKIEKNLFKLILFDKTTRGKEYS